jgi:hypothetical protein
MRKFLYYAVLIFLPGMFTASMVSAQQWLPRGITEPYKNATLSPSVNGIITTIRKREGEFVKQGEVIVELDSDYELLEVERRKLIAESKIEVEASRYRLDMLKLDLDSTQSLYNNTHSVSLEAHQSAVRRYCGFTFPGGGGELQLTAAHGKGSGRTKMPPYRSCGGCDFPQYENRGQSADQDRRRQITYHVVGSD